MAARGLRSLKNVDYTDRELLHILDGQTNDDGWASTKDLYEAIRVNHPDASRRYVTEDEREKYAKRCIGGRFAWMVKFEYCVSEVHPKEGTRWKLTPVGRNLMNGELSPELRDSLHRLSPADRVMMMRELTGAYRNYSRPAQTMIRREWQHGTYRKNGR